MKADPGRTCETTRFLTCLLCNTIKSVGNLDRDQFKLTNPMPSLFKLPIKLARLVCGHPISVFIL